MGSDPIAIPLLDFIYSEHNKSIVLKAIFTQPDRPSGRGKKMEEGPIKVWAKERRIPIYQPEKIGQTYNEWLTQEGIDCALVMAYGQILKKSFLEKLPLGAINWHGSILPYYRGASPIESALLNEEKETGITLMKIVPKMDAGPILALEKTIINADDTSLTLREKMSQTALSIAQKNWHLLIFGQLQEHPQNETLATYTRKITKEDAWLDFSISAKALNAQINAFSIWPGSIFEHQGTIIKIHKAQVLETERLFRTPGQVISSTKDSLHISTSLGILAPTTLQRPGGKILPVDAFLRGYPISPKDILIGKTRTQFITSTKS